MSCYTVSFQRVVVGGGGGDRIRAIVNPALADCWGWLALAIVIGRSPGSEIRHLLVRGGGQRRKFQRSTGCPRCSPTWVTWTAQKYRVGGCEFVVFTSSRVHHFTQAVMSTVPPWHGYTLGVQFAIRADDVAAALDLAAELPRRIRRAS